MSRHKVENSVNTNHYFRKEVIWNGNSLECFNYSSSVHQKKEEKKNVSTLTVGSLINSFTCLLFENNYIFNNSFSFEIKGSKYISSLLVAKIDNLN